MIMPLTLTLTPTLTVTVILTVTLTLSLSQLKANVCKGMTLLAISRHSPKNTLPSTLSPTSTPITALNTTLNTTVISDASGLPQDGTVIPGTGTGSADATVGHDSIYDSSFTNVAHAKMSEVKALLEVV